MPDSNGNTSVIDKESGITPVLAWEWLLALRHQRRCSVAIELLPKGKWQTSETISAKKSALSCGPYPFSASA